MAHNLAVEDATDEERLEVVAEDHESMCSAPAANDNLRLLKERLHAPFRG